MPPWDPKESLQVVWQGQALCPSLIKGDFREHKFWPELECSELSGVFAFLCATPAAKPPCQGEQGVGRGGEGQNRGVYAY